MYWKVGEDPRLDPDYDPLPVPHAEVCENCGAPIMEGDEFYEIQFRRTNIIMCPECAKRWLEDQRRTA